MTGTNKDVYRILFAEDVSTDREMIERLLVKNDFTFVSECVDTEDGFVEMIESFKPTLILVDYRMPTFDGMRALEIAQQKCPNLPFIILTGSMNEDIAVQCMRNGADDYVIKQNLKRLIPAIKSAVDKKRLIKEQKKADRELLLSELKYRTLIEESSDAIYLIYDDKVEFVNKKFFSLLGYDADMVSKGLFKERMLFDNLQYESMLKCIAKLNRRPGDSESCEIDVLDRDGQKVRVELSYVWFQYKNGLARQGVIRDVRDKSKLQKRNAMLFRAIEQSSVSIVITDKDARIEYVNRVFEKYSRRTLEEVIGEKPSILNSKLHSKEFFEKLWSTINSGKEWSGEMRGINEGGEFYWENVSISPVLNDYGEIEHFIGVKEDITERKRNLEELKEAKAKAEESDHLKSAFLRNLNHEFRTPMNSILGFSDLLKKPNIPDSNRNEYIERMSDSGRSLMDTIMGIVNISGDESNIRPLENVEVDIQSFLHDVFISFYTDATLKKLDFVYEQESQKPDYIVLDVNMLRLIVDNIVKNAIHFTHEGSVHFGYKIKEKDLFIYVIDTGQGIHKSKHEVIFERFTQGGDSDTEACEGLGLGLAIAKSCCERMNGYIELKSERNKGSEFTVVIPDVVVSAVQCDEEQPLAEGLKRGKDSETKTVEKSVAPNLARKINALIVEDDADSQLYYREALGSYCEEIFVTGDGEEAVSYAKTHSDLDLILLDIRLEKMEGIEVCEEIRSFNKEVIIIIQTAYANEIDKDALLLAGCNDLISKPVGYRALINLIKKYFKGV